MTAIHSVNTQILECSRNEHSDFYGNSKRKGEILVLLSGVCYHFQHKSPFLARLYEKRKGNPAFPAVLHFRPLPKNALSGKWQTKTGAAKVTKKLFFAPSGGLEPPTYRLTV